MNEFVNEIFLNTIDIVLLGFDNSEKAEIIKGYRNYLYKNYGKIDITLSNIEKLKEVFIDVEKNIWAKKSKEYKQSFLVEDKNLDKLVKLSNFAFEYAKNRINNVVSIILTEEQVEEYINEMKECADNVKDFNKSIAIGLLSEGILDFYFGLNNTENLSFRISRIK